MQVIDRLQPQARDAWGKAPVKLTHTLVGRDMFSDAALARLLDVVDPTLLGIKTMGDHCPDPQAWYRCTCDEASGSDVMAAVERGRLWVNISEVHRADTGFAAILDGMYDDLERQLPHFRTFRRSLGLLISSPSASVVYHADPLGQGLLQLRGRKRVWIYPAKDPFLQPREIEDIVRGVTEEELSYEPWFDEHAAVHELAPGEMLHWQLNAPHRVANLDAVNVSLTTEHWTRHVRNSYAMNYGNGVLRAHGVTPRSRTTSGPAYWVKLGLTAADRVMRRRRVTARPPAQFRVDPAATYGVRPVAPSASVSASRGAARAPSRRSS